MSNCGTIKHKCGSKNYASCILYETPTPEFSSLFESTCTDVEEILTDIYGIVGSVKEDIDVTTLENTCITFIEPKTASSVISQMYEEMCSMKTLIGNQTTLITALTTRVTNLEANACP